MSETTAAWSIPMAEGVNPEKIVESVAIDNLKTIAGGPAFYANLAMSNAVQNQDLLSKLSLTILAKAVDQVSEKQIEEGGVLVAALQQITKAAQTTPPVTA
jgi:hypothetical protein